MKKKQRFGFHNFFYALRGMLLFLRKEPSAHVHLLTTLVASLLGFFLKIHQIEWIIIILASGMVLMAEAINTAIEILADVVTEEWSEAIGEVKDIAAGAVLLIGIAAIVAGIVIFLPKILAFLVISH